jgi:Flp pilus assembly protein TadD
MSPGLSGRRQVLHWGSEFLGILSMVKGVFARTALFLLAWLVSACASQDPYAGTSVINEHQQLLRGAALFQADEPLPQLEPVHLLAVNDDMRAFLDTHVPVKSVSDDVKMRAILRALLDDGLNLQYNNLTTYTAEQTFYARQGNCLSFTNLYVALAREAGIDASYQEVEVPAAWSAVGKRHYFSLHINVLVELRGNRQKVVDFDVQNRSGRVLGTPVSDETAAAQYDNNMAVYYLEGGDLPLAFLHSRRAIEARPQTGYFWANLGTILRRAGAQAEAEEAYLTAIELSEEPSAISNLARLYEKQGKHELAVEYAQKAEYYRAKNPYYLYELAENAYDEGDFETANKLLRSAIGKRHDEPEFYRLYGLTWVQLGKPDKAENSFEKAVRFATNPERTSLYEHKLRLLAEID